MSAMIMLGTVSTMCACIYGLVLVRQQPGLLRTIVKTVPVSMLALMSWAYGGPVLLTLALGFGALGDAFLSRDGEPFFLAGLGAFLCGHLAYILLLAQLGEGAMSFLNQPVRLIAFVLLTLITRSIVRLLLPHLGALRLPVLCYIVVILAMAGAALSLPASWPLGLAMIGALLFIASDAILAFEVFVFDPADPRRSWTAPLLWFLYWGGQLLIMSAVLMT